MKIHIHESNLIENINDEIADQLGLVAWERLKNFPRIDFGIMCKIHRILLADQGDFPGRLLGCIRDYNVTIGRRMGKEPTLIPKLLNNWVLDMVNYREQSPKDMHIRFEHIHPFADGNGRTGRMLMWWHEVKLGNEPTLIKNAEKQDYYRWFDELQGNASSTRREKISHSSSF